MKNMRNSVQIIGNLGNVPEIHEFESGKMAVRFSIATNESFKNAKGEWVQSTNWHNAVAWGGTANFIAQHLTKGTEVALEGKLNNRSYEDAHGKKHFITEIIVNEVLMMQTRKNTKAETEKA